MLDSQRINIGVLPIATAGAYLIVNVSQWQKCSFQAVPRYGASLGSWDAGVKRSIAGAPVDFTSPLGFTSAVLDVSDVDTSGVDTIVIINDAAGSSGFADIWMVGKSVT